MYYIGKASDRGKRDDSYRRRPRQCGTTAKKMTRNERDEPWFAPITRLSRRKSDSAERAVSPAQNATRCLGEIR